MGTRLDMSMVYHPTKGLSEGTDDSNSERLVASMWPLRVEALYGRKCHSRLCYAKIGEKELSVPKIIQETTDKVFQVMKRFEAVVYRQKSYADNRMRPLEFRVGNRVFLKVSPWKGVVRFDNQGKLSPRYIGPFEILKRIGLVAYRLTLPSELSGVRDVFRVSNLKKCLSDETSMIPSEGVRIDDKLHFVEEPVEIWTRKFKNSGEVVPIWLS
ncbi:hypothetical protein QVD17_28648 [Tagetes erecta]|uniref:Tf2-1-like SH3-like domain-containing protein n=1 Tax=Tagetes erecta TaxID=13708 RepID=A0AAD8NSX7_TARER|nr:hypothetical protein QVD17_28648 [Tagetes erecta]